MAARPKEDRVGRATQDRKFTAKSVRRPQLELERRAEHGAQFQQLDYPRVAKSFGRLASGGEAHVRAHFSNFAPTKTGVDRHCPARSGERYPRLRTYPRDCSGAAPAPHRPLRLTLRMKLPFERRHGLALLPQPLASSHLTVSLRESSAGRSRIPRASSLAFESCGAA